MSTARVYTGGGTNYKSMVNGHALVGWMLILNPPLVASFAVLTTDAVPQI
jgi:hypothetical protein